ncbi:UPF0676 protein [Pseudohyphozyma bogoriensis]|nr:UPF0676 protein [Pseudohyphozyma bogoriensis]
MSIDTLPPASQVEEVPIPVVDFAGFENGSGPRAQEIADQFFAACRDVGFVYIVNHGFDDDLRKEMFGWRFFDLPKEVKMKAPHPVEGWWHRGYSAIGRSVAVQKSHTASREEIEKAKRRDKHLDFKESFEFGRENHPRTPNVIIPDEDLPGFREALNRYFAEGRLLQLRVMRAIAMGMPGVPSDFFESYHSTSDNQIRLLHYPPLKTKELRAGEVGRIGEHTDFGSGTLLFQDDTGGLEVEDRYTSRLFHPARPMPGAVIFNIGDFLQRWSNDTLKSTLHRVRCPPDLTGEMTPARYSIPYFFKADADKVVDCLPGTFGEGRPKKYEPVTVFEYVAARLNAAY